MIRIAYAVTFEFETLPPMTHRGITEGSTGAVCASRAMKEAQEVLRPVNWSSFVCVALERLVVPVRTIDQVEPLEEVDDPIS
jgi:hypothetical protein